MLLTRWSDTTLKRKAGDSNTHRVAPVHAFRACSSSSRMPSVWLPKEPILLDPRPNAAVPLAEEMRVLLGVLHPIEEVQ